MRPGLCSMVCPRGSLVLRSTAPYFPREVQKSAVAVVLSSMERDLLSRALATFHPRDRKPVGSALSSRGLFEVLMAVSSPDTLVNLHNRPLCAPQSRRTVSTHAAMVLTRSRKGRELNPQYPFRYGGFPNRYGKSRYPCPFHCTLVTPTGLNQ